MNFIDSPLQDVKIIEPQVFGDERGFFMETYRDSWFKENIADVSFVQDNQSKSSYGILRGLHYQLTQTQGKLVRVIAGEVYDVVVDMRKGSETFSNWFGIYLSASNNKQLWVPPGFAHGFLVTSKSAEFVYKCTNYYHPQSEVTLRYNDEDLDIAWPFDEGQRPSLSTKDLNGFTFQYAPKF